MPEKSDMMFLILAWVIISWPFRMPPSSSPMITRTIAISTRVKPFCTCLMFLSLPDGLRVAYCRKVYASGKSQGKQRIGI
jgi:hypothetical protein